MRKRDECERNCGLKNGSKKFNLKFNKKKLPVAL